ncbi:MAG TPA: DUF721 domain-containing protein [Bacteroidales bacterium]|nr:DUF721 domain-containing protein [Bacteroidales bacterium]HPS16919.1 DUF721 domain-containing protein [Bacteroidales bacterium]
MGCANEYKIHDLINALMDDYNLSDKLNEVKINKLWPKVVGKIINKHTKALYYRDKKLYVTLDNAALKEEMHYARAKLMKMLNKQAGEEIVVEILFK